MPSRQPSIEFRAKVGQGLFKHPGKKHMQDDVIAGVVAKLDMSAELKAFDAKIVATLEAASTTAAMVRM